ncbi:MAG: hypothetical protein U5Q44_01880 [Dehalococcoidia bacterium]|nr:hypothetical protein [Dehalococcoidia bacterium]
MPASYRDYARLLLGAIRLINGAIALVAPQIIMGRFDTKDTPVAAYGLRMFGIRTVLIAIDLFRKPGPERRQAVRVAPIIHASDTVAAVIAARSGQVPSRTGMLIVAISTLNTLLALAMQGTEDDR